MKSGCVVFVLIDGLADISLNELNGKTPLEAANTPTMDELALKGLNGLMDPVSPGLACGSDTAHMSILGYDPFIHYRGRGSFEAMGAGLNMDKGDVAFKCNFATVDDKNIVIKRRVDRNFPEWGIDLCAFLDRMRLPSFPDIQVRTKYATEHRCGIVLKGPGLCDKITGTDPLKDNLPLRQSEPIGTSQQALFTSSVLNEVSSEIHKKLSSHPINKERVAKNQPPGNIVLLRGPGERINVPTFEETHGLKPFMIAPTCIIAGLGLSLGFDLLKAPNATGDYHTNLISKAETALKALEPKDSAYDFAFIHIKAVDDAGHDKDIEKKVHFIEKSDEMMKVLVNGLRRIAKEQQLKEPPCVVLTGDHTTPVAYGDHSFEPVPLLITQLSQETNNMLQDNVKSFSELAAARGALGRFKGDQVMKIIKAIRSPNKH